MIDIENLILDKNFESIKKWMIDISGNYQVYNPFTNPITPDETSLVYKKFIDLNYKKEDFEGRSVADLGCCLGFFTIYSYFLGAKKSIGYDNDLNFLKFNRSILKDYERADSSVISKLKFEEINLLSFPELEKTDIILAHSILHWFFILDRSVSMRDILAWMHTSCSEAIYFEGCVDFDDPIMLKYNVATGRCSKDIFINEAKKIFSRVEILGNMSYHNPRIKARLYK